MRSLLLRVALIAITFTRPAFADWWIVRSAGEACLIVDVEPTGKDKGVVKIGKDSYQTAEAAEADAKQLCQDSNALPKRGEVNQ